MLWHRHRLELEHTVSAWGRLSKAPPTGPRAGVSNPLDAPSCDHHCPGGVDFSREALLSSWESVWTLQSSASPFSVSFDVDSENLLG